jgi:hypothetical protein
MSRRRKAKSYSHSKLELYDNCPWAYRLSVLEGIPRGESEALVTGRVLHEVIARYLEHLIRNRLQTDWEWAEQAPLTGVSEDVKEVWARFYNGFLLPPLDQPGVEARLAFDRTWRPTEFFGKDAYFRMVLDWHFRQAGLAVIQDWKSGWWVPENLEKDRQLRIYGWGLKQAVYPDAREVLLRLHYLRSGKEMEALLEPQELEGIPDLLQEKIRGIEADRHFDPRPGSFCGICGLTAHCPVMAQALVPVEVMAPATRQDAEQGALLLLTLQKLENELASRLKEWVKVNGPLAVGNLIYGPKPGVSYDLDPQLVTLALLEAGLSREEVWPLLSISKTGLERGLRKLRRKDLIEVALSTGISKFSERIEFCKGESQ